MLALITHADIVVVLDADGHAEFAGALGAFFKRCHHQVPLGRVTTGRIFVTGEDAHQISTKIVRQARQFSDVVNLDLALRHFAVLQIAGEIVVARDAEVVQVALLEMVAQLRAFFWAVVQQREVWPFGSEHYAFIAQRRRLVDELVERQMRLSPGTGITDRMQ